MSGYLAARIDFFEECWAEIRGSKGYRRMMALYSAAFVLLKLAPEAAHKISGFQWPPLLSFRTWIIIFLALVVIAIIDSGTRVVQKHVKTSLRPKLEGEIFDLDFEPYYEPNKEAVLKARERKTAIVFSNSDIVGTHVFLGVRFINEGDAETTIRNFRLEIGTTDKQFTGKYPEDGEIVQQGAEQSRSEAKRFFNLNTHVKNMRTIALKKLVNGHLHFIVRDLLLSQERLVVVNVQVIAIDQWGDEHSLPLVLSQNTVPRPSERLHYVPPKLEFW